MKKGQTDTLNRQVKKLKHPHDLMELGKKYPALKSEYDQLKILCDRALYQKMKAEIQSDKLLKRLKRKK